VQKDPIINQMLEITNVVLELKEDADTIGKYQEEIGEVARILATPENLSVLSMDERKKLCVERENQLRAKRDNFYVRSDLHEKKPKKLPKASKDVEISKSEVIEQINEVLNEKKVMAHFFKTTNSFGPNLLTFLEVPNLPATNNETEQTFGKVRTNLRRITGRQNNHSTIYKHGSYLVLVMNNQTIEQIKKRISGVSYSEYCAERKSHMKKISHLTVKSRLRKDSKKFFTDLELQWIVANSQ